ncbi:MAG TPA: gamma-glutamyl-gamma-aminobutyrate hydrolase family protein, partial [Burkholderiaceae bacterium]|nr:gamma-glutamyl-gamma-aminobutyrate hydrolase family protein [Burkholderiaceae bacterium]
MSEQPLRIGLSARLMHTPPKELGFHGKTLQYLEQSLAHWIMNHGALAFMIPTLGQDAKVLRGAISVRDYVSALDGLVLQGGADVSPESYGEQPVRPEWSGDRMRDLFEIELVWEFVIQHKPVLGICRGAQLINVACGG